MKLVNRETSDLNYRISLAALMLVSDLFREIQEEVKQDYRMYDEIVKSTIGNIKRI